VFISVASCLYTRANANVSSAAYDVKAIRQMLNVTDHRCFGMVDPLSKYERTLHEITRKK
jgi:hypothetical protein